MHKEICVFINRYNQNIDRITLEVLSAAWQLSSRLKTKLTAVLIGKNVQPMALGLGQYGIDSVYLFEDDEFNESDIERVSEAIVHILKEFKPRIFLIGAIPRAREIGGRVAFRIEASFLPDCMDLVADENLTLTGIRPINGKKVFIKSTSESAQYQIASIRPNSFPQQKNIFNNKCKILDVKLELPVRKLPFQKMDYIKADPLTLDLTEAEIIIAGGRGIKEETQFRLLEELGKQIGGTVGCSRAIVDLGWLPKSKQIGQSGKMVSSKLYIACGISGASQHILGMKDSQNIIAINKDEYAPIFKIADLGLVGDLSDVLPLIIHSLKKL